MKIISIAAVFALITLCSSVPIANQELDLATRVDILSFLYDNILQDFFSGLVTNTFGTISGALNNLIQTNPLGVGKRDLPNDLQARIDIFTFLYDNILQDFFSGLVTNTFGTISGALNNLIQTNPLGVGKRDLPNDLQARIDIFTFLYDNILQDFFSGLVTNTFGTISGALNNLIQTNPLGVGKRDLPNDLQARIDIFTFLYDNILQDFFSGLVTNTFGTISGALNNLIQTNPLGIGKRDLPNDLQARIDIFSFLYDNILQDFFSGLVTNTFGTISGALNNLIQTNPLGIGKRDLQDDLVARVDLLSFLYDNILQDFFSGLVSNTFGTISGALNNLIQTNPLGIGKREERLDVNIFQFLYDNVIADLFGGLASNTANYLQNSLNNLLNKPFQNLGKRSVNIEQAQAIIAQTIPTLVQKFKTFVKQAITLLNDREKLNQLVKDTIAEIKSNVHQLAQQLSQVIPSTIVNEVSKILATLQAALIFWTSGLGSSLGPVIGPFLP